MNLTSGSSVMDVGCGTGASFPYLENVIGENGRNLGIEPSKSMIPPDIETNQECAQQTGRNGAVNFT